MVARSGHYQSTGPCGKGDLLLHLCWLLVSCPSGGTQLASIPGEHQWVRASSLAWERGWDGVVSAPPGHSLKDFYWHHVGSVQGCCWWATRFPKLQWRCSPPAAPPGLGSPEEWWLSAACASSIAKPCYRFVPVQIWLDVCHPRMLFLTPASKLIFRGKIQKSAWGWGAPSLCIPFCLWTVGSSGFWEPGVVPQPLPPLT